MKKIFKSFLKNYLKLIAKIVLLVNKPYIIVIAGSTDKSFFKEEISDRLRNRGYSVRSNIKSFNTDIGLPLAILSLPSGYGDYRAWWPVIKAAPGKIFEKNFPKILVLELGVSDPGDMRYLLSIINAKIAILTNITQRYIESFSGMDELAGEYEYLAAKIGPDGILIYNNDNPRLNEIAAKSSVKKISFGLIEGSDWSAANIEKGIGASVAQVIHGEDILSEHIQRPGEHRVYARIAGLIIDNLVNFANIK